MLFVLAMSNRWTECNYEVNADFMADFVRDLALVIPPMLEDGVRAMIYAGDQDLICNWVGNKRWAARNASCWWGQRGPHLRMSRRR
jgi:serine carboxypeptidase-like clade IV